MHVSAFLKTTLGYAEVYIQAVRYPLNLHCMCQISPACSLEALTRGVAQGLRCRVLCVIVLKVELHILH